VLLATRHSACAAKVSATNQLEALIVGAPEELRAELRGLTTKHQIRRCAVMRDQPARSLEHRMTVRALRTTAERIQLLAGEAADFRVEQSGWSPRSRLGCWSCPASDRSASPRSWSAGRTPAAALGGRLCCPGRRQPDPSILRAGHQASPEPLG
jgi:hypothetical protein